MRLKGAKIKEICAAMGRGEGAVTRAIKGIKCPVDHLQASYERHRPPEWVPHAREMRHNGRTYQEIADVCGTSKPTVIKYCRDIPFDGRSKRDPGVVARAVETRKANLAQAIEDGRVVPKPKAKEKPRKRTYVPGRSRMTKSEQRRRMVHRLVMSGTQQRSAPITLPKIRFLEGVDV